MTILFLHGKESKPGGTKPTYLAHHGLSVLNPALPDEDFDEAVRIAQAEFDRHMPDVVIGSSRGGAVAMNIIAGNTPLVLMAPAWRKWGAARAIKVGTVVLHSRADKVIPFSDSEELVRNSGLTSALVEVGSDHRLSTPDALAMLLRGVQVANTGAPVQYGSKVTPEDCAQLDFIHAELHKPGLTTERREELEWALSSFADKYCFDWLEEELRNEGPK
jgi:hypothetical protein